ncbi:DNA translocase FtsK 4TM domain-containing protein, partial [Reichenbachiella sp.]
MAKNTFKNQTKEKRQFKLPSLSIGFLNDRRFHLSLGFLTLISSLFLLTAFISYLFTGKADQSLMGNIAETGLKASGLEAENWLGLFGAYTAHYFIYQFFGIASFLIPPFLFLIGYKIVFDREILPISKSFWFTIFFLLWVSIFIGYFMINSERINIWGFLGGGTGFELAILFDSLMGWGTLLFLLFALAVFSIYFFNITRMVGLGSIPTLDSRLDQIAEEDMEVEGSGEGDLSDANDSDTIAAVVEAIKEEVEKEEAEALTQEPEEAEEWKVETKKPAAKKQDKPDLVLDVDEPTDKPASRNKPTPPVIEKEDDLALEVEKPEVKEQVTDQLENYDPTLDLAKYVYPTPDLLIDYPEKNVQVSKEELEQNKDKIVETLINFKIGISSIKATIGPTVTLYEIVPEAGVKISKIKNL